MSDTKAEFDKLQGHGDHFGSIFDDIEMSDFLRTLPELLQTADNIGITENEISCNLGEDSSKQMHFVLLGDLQSAGRVSMLIGCDAVKGSNSLLSFYPEYDGAEIKIKLTAICEWANGVEATLKGLILNDEREVAFFDTRYCLNKEKYSIGSTYLFKVSAFSYHQLEILKDTIFKIEGEQAINHYRILGEEIKYEADGSVSPISCSLEELVAFLQHSERYPHVFEFQSPILELEKTTLFNGNFYKFNIAIANNVDDEQIIIPLIAKKSLFADVPKVNEPLRGMVWLQGYCISEIVESNNDSEEKKTTTPLENIKSWSYDITKDDPDHSNLNAIRSEIFYKVYLAWTTLDSSYLKEFLKKDFKYGSFWVADQMVGADTYFEYITKKFENIRNSTSKLTVERVLLHNGASAVNYNYALFISQGDNKSLLLFSFDKDKISELYMTDSQLYQFVPLAISITDKNGDVELFKSPKPFFKKGEMSKKDLYSFILNSYIKRFLYPEIKIKKCDALPTANHPHLILNIRGTEVYLFCDIFTPPDSDGTTHLDTLKGFVEYAKSQGAMPAMITLGAFCMDTDGEKALYGGNFSMKISSMVFF